MVTPLYIRILEYLEKRNAVSVMVDIKPAFDTELHTLQKRKDLKASLDHLLNENLIQSASGYEFLDWDETDGEIVPLRDEKIELKLSGKWQAYLAAKSKPHTAAEKVPAKIKIPVSGPAVKLHSTADMPLGPASLHSGGMPHSTPAPRKVNGANSDNPFAGLDVIALHPDKSKKSNINTILKWLVALSAVVLLVLVYFLYMRHKY